MATVVEAWAGVMVVCGVVDNAGGDGDGLPLLSNALAGVVVECSVVDDAGGDGGLSLSSGCCGCLKKLAAVVVGEMW